jgi:hypothetical protein
MVFIHRPLELGRVQCNDYLRRCYCSTDRIVYYQSCGGGRNGIPHHCGQCVAFGGC